MHKCFHSVINSFVGFGNPIGKAVGVFFDNSAAAFGAAAIDYYIFVVGKGLCNNAFNGFLQAGGVVEVYVYY
jgi:hypothetical protein